MLKLAIKQLCPNCETFGICVTDLRLEIPGFRDNILFKNGLIVYFKHIVTVTLNTCKCYCFKIEVKAIPF